MLSFAALSVRPYFLAIFDNYLIPLGFDTLRPALKALILCLLPGLEDAQSEDFDKILQTLDKLRASPETHSSRPEMHTEEEGSQISFFWQCFFLATITSSTKRQGALAFLTQRLPKFGTRVSSGKSDLKNLLPEAKAALYPEPGLLIRCLAAGVSDKQLLVQRGFLDLLVTNLPLDSEVLQRSASQSDLERLVAAATGVVMRRDMSLNRRLWTWLLGPEPKSDSEAESLNSERDTKSPSLSRSAYQSAYFSELGLRPLTNSIMALVNSKPTSTAERAKPFRICLSLMDKWEVGGLLIPSAFIPALESAYNFSKSASKQDSEEVIRSASIFFDGVESGLIWTKFIELALTALASGSIATAARKEKLGLCTFILQRFNLREEEMLQVHIPLAALAIMLRLKTIRSPSEVRDNIEESIEMLGFDVVDRLVSLLPERVFSMHNESSQFTADDVISNDCEQSKSIANFYGKNQGNIDGLQPPFRGTVVGHLLLLHIVSLFARSLNNGHTPKELELCTRTACSLLPKVADVSGVLSSIQLFSTLEKSLSDNQNTPNNFVKTAGIIHLIVTVQATTMPTPYFTPLGFPAMQRELVRLLWTHLSPDQPKYHVEAVRAFWLLSTASPSIRAVEAFLSDLLVEALQPVSGDPACSAADAGRRFAVLWTHSVSERTLQADKSQRAILRRPGASAMLAQGGNAGDAPPDPSLLLTRPLFLLLDTLDEEGTEVAALVTGWLQDLPGLSKVFDNLISKIQTLKCFRTAGTSQLSSTLVFPERVNGDDDTHECLYYLRHILHILRNASEHTWLTVAGETSKTLQKGVSEEASNIGLQKLLAYTCLRSLDINDYVLQEAQVIDELHRVALNIIQLLIAGPFSAPLKELELDNSLLERINGTIATAKPLQQACLLEATTAALKLRQSTFVSPPTEALSAQWKQSKEGPRLEAPTSRDSSSETSSRPSIPPLLVECLKAGFSNLSSHVIMDSWVSFLVETLPLFAESIFQNLIPLVECFCKQINIVFDRLNNTFKCQPSGTSTGPESTLISLMNGLEQVLARAHERLITEEARLAGPKSPVAQQGFFNNVMQGVLTNEGPQPVRTATANTRLTVLLCFQDAVRTCFNVWCWGLSGAGHHTQDGSSLASFGYTSLRMRNRARRLLEHLFAAETLESLEALAVLWSRPPTIESSPEAVMSLLNVLTGARPKHTMPSIFNAIYSRTNPSGLDPSRMSSLTSELTDIDLISFLIGYTQSIDDDAIDEVWGDCVTFLKDVLANPMPYRQMLPALLEFIALLAEKVDDTTLGEQRKMRRELGVSTEPPTSC